MVKVELYFNLRNLAGRKEIQIEGKTLREVLKNLIELYPSLKPALFKNENEILEFISIFINGRRLKNRLDLSLKPGDRISIFPPVAGG